MSLFMFHLLYYFLQWQLQSTLALSSVCEEMAVQYYPSEKGKKIKSSKVKEIFSHSVGCLIHYLIVCVFISIDFSLLKTDGEKITCCLLNTGTITAGAHILYHMNNAIHK